jgi:hypothetical protein
MAVAEMMRSSATPPGDDGDCEIDAVIGHAARE